MAVYKSLLLFFFFKYILDSQGQWPKSLKLNWSPSNRRCMSFCWIKGSVLAREPETPVSLFVPGVFPVICLMRISNLLLRVSFSSCKNLYLLYTTSLPSMTSARGKVSNGLSRHPDIFLNLAEVLCLCPTPGTLWPQFASNSSTNWVSPTFRSEVNALFLEDLPLPSFLLMFRSRCHFFFRTAIRFLCHCQSQLPCFSCAFPRFLIR